MAYKKYHLFIILFILSFLFIFTACSTNSNSTGNKQPVTRLISYSEANINREVTNLTADYNELKARFDTVTEETKEQIKKDIAQLRINIVGFDEELTKAVEDNKLAKDVKKTFDSFIENMKTNLDNLDKKI